MFWLVVPLFLIYYYFSILLDHLFIGSSWLSIIYMILFYIIECPIPISFDLYYSGLFIYHNCPTKTLFSVILSSQMFHVNVHTISCVVFSRQCILFANFYPWCIAVYEFCALFFVNSFSVLNRSFYMILYGFENNKS